MMPNLTEQQRCDYLRDEYLMLQSQYEDYDNHVRGLGYFSRQLQVAGIALAGLFLVAAAKRA